MNAIPSVPTGENEILLSRAQKIREAAAELKLFADKDWLVSPVAFPLPGSTVETLNRLGHWLWKFQKACNLLYLQSVRGKQPAWIAEYLDRGKPADLVEIGRHKALAGDLPAVIRPDLILTEDGFKISELDTVPGGIGLTGWLAETYAELGEPVVGGAHGMWKGFSSILRGGKIAVSAEAATYRPEMDWACKRMAELGLTQSPVKVVDAETAEPFDGTLYRFFELFDLPNLPASRDLLAGAVSNQPRITPPPKAFLEEKLWFALFWLLPLREFWRRELGERHLLALQKIIPRTWILDPSPLPHFGAIPGLEIQSWDELARFTQKEREFVLKISGFSETAWGARGVTVAQDLPQKEWAEALRNALDGFEEHPHILQVFHKGRLFDQPYLDHDGQRMLTMRGRVRLCPYYFVDSDKVEMGGALATICPADKKIIHGMRDAIMAPLGEETEE